MVPDNSKRNLHNFYMKKEEHVQLFIPILKRKRMKLSFFVEYTTDHFKGNAQFVQKVTFELLMDIKQNQYGNWLHLSY